MRIKCFVMDVDGTLTDGKIYMGAMGEAVKAFNIKDGYGIHDILLKEGVTPIIITGRESDILYNRCQELGITELYQNISNKVNKLKEILQNDLLNDVAYIGDDLNDLGIIEFINESGGITACPEDAVERVKLAATYVCKHKGGDGAVREFIDYLDNIGSLKSINSQNRSIKDGISK